MIVSPVTRRYAPPLFVAGAIAFVVANLQAEMTWYREPGLWVTQDYLGGKLPAVFQARPLAGWILRPCLAAGLPFAFVYFWFNMIAWWAGLACTWGAARRITGSDAQAMLAAALTAVFAATGFFHLGYSLTYPYDAPALAFGAAGLWAVVSGRIVPMAVVVAVGTINKETTLWLIPAWMFGARTRGTAWKPLLRDTAILMAAYGAVYFGIRSLVVDTAGITVQAVYQGEDGDAGWRLTDNLRELAFLGAGGSNQNVHLLALVFAFSYWGSGKHRLVRRLHLATIFHIIPIMIMGNIRELRLFQEILPLMAAGCALALTEDAERTTPPD